MFRNEDKMTLALINAIDINGKIISRSLPLPLKQTTLPKNIVSVEVFEYHEDIVDYYAVPFSIHVGEVTTLEKLIPYFSDGKVIVKNDLEIPSPNSYLCVQNINGLKKIIALVNENDIVVKNYEELEFVVQKLSYHYNQIHNATEEIKKLTLIGKKETSF